ncbi:hypothetical protein A2U01_0110637 [Trifolium medium]|uniref:Uncharacterized protein n=1 Tax=Trifolium medium TaxID=97028 RepID=A0A392VPK9_9FABA|nr:hypothetical protein [Trifolium medium]
MSESYREVAMSSLILASARQLEDFLLPFVASPRQSSLSEQYWE